MAGLASQDVILVDGSVDFSGGVNSVKVTTVKSQRNPNGLDYNELAWLDNATVRDGGITQRTGWQPLCKVSDATGFFQGEFLYEPTDGLTSPYHIIAINGHILQVFQDNAGQYIVDLSKNFNLFMPTTQPYFYFCQAEEFLIIQAGDYTTLPLIWDGGTLFRSKGITNTAVAPGTQGVNQIPAAGPMDYFMGRLWYAQGRQYSAGDIVGGPSGTAHYNERDSLLNVTESPLVLGGDGFTVPDNAGNIRAIKHNASINTQLGQGTLYIFTVKAIYSLAVPVDRAAWIATTSNAQPLQTVVQLSNGSVNDRGIVPVNGDLYFQSLEPSIRSLIAAVRYFQQAGNIEISAEEERILAFNDRALLHFATGIFFDNRLLMSALPIQQAQGVVHQAIIPLDFVPQSTIGGNNQPVWEGMYEGLDVFQLTQGNFGGLDRAFALVRSRVDASIWIWELTNANRFENGDNRVTWAIEFPAFTWSDEMALKKLTGGELWVDKLFGQVEFKLQYRPDSDVCWKEWHQWQRCSARNSCEDVHNPACYPITDYRESYLSTMQFPVAPEVCESNVARPSNIAFQFQVRLIIHGWCRVRGLRLYAEARDRASYEAIVC